MKVQCERSCHFSLWVQMNTNKCEYFLLISRESKSVCARHGSCVAAFFPPLPHVHVLTRSHGPRVTGATELITAASVSLFRTARGVNVVSIPRRGLRPETRSLPQCLRSLCVHHIRRGEEAFSGRRNKRTGTSCDKQFLHFFPQDSRILSSSWVWGFPPVMSCTHSSV